jgi:hypothetical protein
VHSAIVTDAHEGTLGVFGFLHWEAALFGAGVVGASTDRLSVRVAGSGPESGIISLRLTNLFKNHLASGMKRAQINLC